MEHERLVKVEECKKKSVTLKIEEETDSYINEDMSLLVQIFKRFIKLDKQQNFHSKIYKDLFSS